MKTVSSFKNKQLVFCSLQSNILHNWYITHNFHNEVQMAIVPLLLRGVEQKTAYNLLIINDCAIVPHCAKIPWACARLRARPI